jgi:HSP20 family protein
MGMRDLIPWNRGRDLTTRRSEEVNPFLTLHREMNRLFDDVFRGFDLTPVGSGRLLDRGLDWPNVEVSETDKEVRSRPNFPASTRRTCRWTWRAASLR